MTLRRRVLGYLLLAAFASSLLTVGVAVVLVRHRIASQRMSTLENQANVLAAIGGAPGALGPGDHVYGIGTGRTRRLGRARAAAILAAIPATGDHQGTLDVLGRSLLYAARVTPAGRVILVSSAGLAFAQWRPFLWSLVLSGLGGALFAAVLSYLLARRLARPLAELSAATTRVASGESGVQVPVQGRDELADLGSSFNAMSVQLGAARESHRGFLESVSHELKTPLTSIRGYAEAVEEGAVGPAEGGRVIATEADRLERLVHDLLDLARFDRVDFSVAHEPVDLSAVAAQAVERHLPRARELSVKLGSSHRDGTIVLADPGRLLQATSNLIENALRLTPPGGSVSVHTVDGSIVVTDTGPGLSEDDVPHAFERFYLHDRYRSERPVGSGLGLAIVRELVVAMGGTVDAASASGGGAQFRITLPRCAPTGALPPSA